VKDHYDYIITGAGCAGLSLLRRMMTNRFFDDKNILLIDKSDKTSNDRTWCFWEQEAGFFEDIVFHRWKQIDFFSNDFSARFDMEPYAYKMIRGIDLYTLVLDEAKRHANIDIYNESVTSVDSNDANALVICASRSFSADYVFNSLLFDDWRQNALQKKNIYVLLQHFKGWLIETDKDIFDEHVATFMDFRVSQEKGTTFMYVMPLSKNEALVEYTLFTDKILEPGEYDAELSTYISNFMKIDRYSVKHTEFGVIPMTNYPFSGGEKRVINIGTAGGQTKASSGYTFQFIQKHSDRIIDALTKGEDPLLNKSFLEKRFGLYDRIFLNVLYKKKMRGDELFATLFQKNTLPQVLKFLDNETTLPEEIKIMNSVPLRTFLPASLEEVFS